MLNPMNPVYMPLVEQSQQEQKQQEASGEAVKNDEPVKKSNTLIKLVKSSDD